MIITGNRSNPRAKAMDAGASAFLTKPFSVQDLMARIESTLKH
jgi:DNA-binding response OmpR family regulator